MIGCCSSVRIGISSGASIAAAVSATGGEGAGRSGDFGGFAGGLGTAVSIRTLAFRRAMRSAALAFAFSIARCRLASRDALHFAVIRCHLPIGPRSHRTSVDTSKLDAK